MQYEDAKVNIRGDIVRLFNERFGNGPGSPRLQPSINTVLEKVWSGRLVELNDQNLASIKVVAEHFKCTIDEALNIALGSIEFELKPTPKHRITLARGERLDVRKNKNPGVNPVTSY